MNTSLSVSLNNAVNKIISNNIPNLYRLKVTLSSISDSKNVVELMYIENLHIFQDFINSYADRIELTFEVPPEHYLTIMDMSQNLKCNIVMYNIDREHPDLQLTSVIAKLEYRAVIKDKSDLLKKYSYGALIKTDNNVGFEQQYSTRIPMSLQLLDQRVYEMRKVKLNYIGRATNMLENLYFLADNFNADSVYIVTPDNTKTYTNLILPPMLGITNVFNYLQNDEGKGVYNKGISYYYTNGVLYIYPPYEMNPSSPNMVNIYKVQENMFIGLDSYHKIEKARVGNDIHILSNTASVDKNLIDEGLENDGTAYYLQKAHVLVDAWRNIVEKPGGRRYSVNENVDLVSFNTDKGMISNAFQPNFYLSPENNFTYLSNIAKNNRVAINLGWIHAIPFTFKPGWKLIYNYDENANYVTKTGVCDGVVYTFSKVGRLTEQIYACNANMAISVAI